MGELGKNLRELPKNAWRSLFRIGLPKTDKDGLRAINSSVVLHVHSSRVHPHTLKWWYSLGLGIISLHLFIILIVTGVVLMIYYVPTMDEAYVRMQDLMTSVHLGRVMRNLHRWGGHAMVVVVFLHMMRVFYTGAYKPPREANWVAGLGLLALTLALAFTGYLLPMDQLGYWAAVIGANIAGSPKEVTDALGVTDSLDVGGFTRRVLLGGRDIGDDALIRFYVLHCVILPLVTVGAVAFHLFRIRRDGGLSRPDASPETAAPESASLDPKADEAEP